MTGWPVLILIPLLSAFIGWITNLIAIKMLFHPRLPMRIGPLTFQGIFPKRQAQFAARLGKLVSQELLSFGEIENKITDPQNLQKVLPEIEKHVEHFLKTRLSDAFPMLSMFIGDKTINQLKSLFMQELEELFPQVMKNYMGTLSRELDLEKIVAEKVSNFSSDKLEALLYQIMSKEFRFVEILGGVLGFLIGLVQVAVTFLVTK